jgi:hypothetical protein
MRARRGVIDIEPRWLVVRMEGEGEIALAVEEAAVGPLVNGDEALESPEKASVAEKRRGEGGGWNGRGMRKIDFGKILTHQPPESQPWERTQKWPRRHTATSSHSLTRPVLALAQQARRLPPSIIPSVSSLSRSHSPSKSASPRHATSLTWQLAFAVAFPSRLFFLFLWSPSSLWSPSNVPSSSWPSPLRAHTSVLSKINY